LDLVDRGDFKKAEFLLEEAMKILNKLVGLGKKSSE
jgi:hypothetical protein